MSGATHETEIDPFGAHPRHTSEHVSHVGENDSSDQSQTDQSRPSSDIEFDIEHDHDSSQ